MVDHSLRTRLWPAEMIHGGCLVTVWIRIGATMVRTGERGRKNRDAEFGPSVLFRLPRHVGGRLAEFSGTSVSGDPEANSLSVLRKEPEGRLNHAREDRM